MTTSSRPALLVSGASGRLGRRVLELLLAAGAGPLIATTRAPDRLADLAARGVSVRAADLDADEATLAAAFAGADRALLVSTDALGTGRRPGQHRRALAAFARAGVRHVVYTSFARATETSIVFAVDHRDTERALAEGPLDHTILRNNIYADALLGWLPPAIASGELADARGDGAIAFVTREDCARVAAAALRAARPGRRVVEVTGPRALTSADLAAIATRLSGRPVVHRAISLAEAVERQVAAGLPRPMAEAFAGADREVAAGDLATVTDAVAQWTGEPAMDVERFLAGRL